jgi:hypothetical protein
MYEQTGYVTKKGFASNGRLAGRAIWFTPEDNWFVYIGS